jgi:hypothetical protein
VLTCSALRGGDIEQDCATAGAEDGGSERVAEPEDWERFGGANTSVPLCGRDLLMPLRGGCAVFVIDVAGGGEGAFPFVDDEEEGVDTA